MKTITANLTKFQVGAASAALVAATTLTPMAIAEARPDLVPITPVSQIIGEPSLMPIDISVQGPWWWVGSDPNPNVAAAAAPSYPQLPGETIFEFKPLSLVPGFLKPLAGWFLNLIPRFSVCVAGLGVQVGPYGSVSVKSGAC